MSLGTSGGVRAVRGGDGGSGAGRLRAFLSGGVDSSAIVGIMAEQLDRPVRTFTIGFEDSDGFDERPYARLVAERLRTDHHEFVVKPDAVDLVERLVWHHDQPFGAAAATGRCRAPRTWPCDQCARHASGRASAAVVVGPPVPGGWR
ncbi:MAG: asparagine synthase-related protein [Solirubrobacteraceae bacterium]